LVVEPKAKEEAMTIAEQLRRAASLGLVNGGLMEEAATELERLLAASQELELIISNLRHAYMQLAAGTVRLQKEFADGLIAPQIRKLEKMVNEGNDPCKATTRHIFPDA
jgi:hypothetical protein